MAIKTASSRRVTNSSTLSSAYSATAIITQVVITDSNYDALDDTAVSSAGGYIKIFGIGFMPGYSLYYNGVAIATSTRISSSEIRAVIPSIANGTYNLTLFNTNNTGALYVLTASGFPTWTTSSYVNLTATVSVQLLVSGDAPLTYTLQGGSSLPTGVTLSSSGLLSGTITGLTGSTTYTFTVIVTDAQLQNTQQLITLYVNLADPQFNLTTLLLNGEGSGASNNATNSSFLDSSASAIAITQNNGVYQGTFSPFSASSWSNYFDGSGDYLTLAANAAFTFGTGDFTIECWIYLLGTAGNYTIYDSRTAGSSVSINWYFQGSNNLSLMVSGTNRIAQGSAFPANVWYHVALSRVSGSTKLFVNGTQAGSTYADANDYNQGIPTIGHNASAGGGDNSFPGYISNFRIIKGTGLYTTTFTPSTIPLTAVSGTSLLTCQSNILSDASSNAFAITRNGDTYVTKFNPFANTATYDPAIHGGSIAFYTTGIYLSMPTNAGFDFGTGDFTFEFWMWLPATGASGDGAFLSGSASGSSDLVWTAGTLRFGRNAIAWDTTSSAFSPTTQQWYHIAFVKTSGTAKIFVNGVSIASAGNSNTYSTQGGSVYIGRSTDGSRSFSGIMSNIRVVKGTAVYTSNFTPPTSILTAISGTTFLLNGTNGGIIDQTGKNNIRIFGDAKISTAVKKYNSGSMFFDGTGDYLTATSNFNFGTGDVTMECWIYANSLTGSAFGICGTHGALTDSKTLLYVYGTGSIGIGKIGANEIASTTGLITTGIWYHVAAVRSGSTTTVYINGASVATNTTDVWDTNTSPFNVAFMNPSNGLYWNGYIDDVRITLGFARYTANFTAPTSAFIGQ